MLTVEVDARQVTARLNSMPDKLRAAFLKKTQALVQTLKSKVQQNLTNQILQIRTGKLSRSIFKEVTNTDNEVSGRVYSSGLKYAKIQEFGGTIKHPGGTAYIPGGGSAFAGAALFVSNAKAAVLAASKKGELPRTKPHNIVIPAAHYMGKAFDAMKPEITARYEEAAKEGTK